MVEIDSRLYWNSCCKCIASEQSIHFPGVQPLTSFQKSCDNLGIPDTHGTGHRMKLIDDLKLLELSSCN
jgi:hypothetical protein